MSLPNSYTLTTKPGETAISLRQAGPFRWYDVGTPVPTPPPTALDSIRLCLAPWAPRGGVLILYRPPR